MNKVNSPIEQESEAPKVSEAKARKHFRNLAVQFARLPMIIFADVRNGKLKHRDVCLYAHLLVKQGTNKSTFWGIAPLAQLTGTSCTNVKESLRRLVACGHIQRQRSKLTTHTICLTTLTPGLGFQGIQVKGKDVGEIEAEESSELVKVSLRQPKVRKGQASKRRSLNQPAKEENDADTEKAFLQAWDENLAAVRAEDQSRQWAAIQSVKY